jgi:hypothetical protein
VDDFAIKQATAPVCCRRFHRATGFVSEQAEAKEGLYLKRRSNGLLQPCYDAQGADGKDVRDGLVYRP